MIVAFPTALYSSKLQKVDGGTQSITFLISSENPPRPITTALQLFRGEEVKQLPPRIIPSDVRRKSFGELVFSISLGNQNHTGIGNKPFEVGQLLDFSILETLGDISQLEIPDQLDLQHNTNLPDLTIAGLTEDEIKLLLTNANKKFIDLSVQFRNIQSLIHDLSAQIDENQRLINEIRRSISAADVIFAVTEEDGEVILRKLNDKEKELLSDRDELISSLNIANADAKLIFNQILELKEVIR